MRELILYCLGRDTAYKYTFIRADPTTIRNSTKKLHVASLEWHTVNNKTVFGIKERLLDIIFFEKPKNKLGIKRVIAEHLFLCEGTQFIAQQS